MVPGLNYLHNNKIIHRDLKPENVMFSKKMFTLSVKIGDISFRRIPDSVLINRVGTHDYMALEAFTDDNSFPADIFSLGLVIWEVV